MTFWPFTISHLISVIAGFVFSIFLFHLTNKLMLNKEQKNLEKNLQKEFEYNEFYLENVLKGIKQNIENNMQNDRRSFSNIDYKGFQRIFFLQYFQKGYLYEKVDSDEIQKVDSLLYDIIPFRSDHLMNLISDWKNEQEESEQEKKRAFIQGLLKFERDLIEKHIQTLKKVKSKIFKK